MKRYLLVASLFIAAFIITTVGNVGNSDAQKNSRLCGISIGTMAIISEIKQPSGKDERKSVDKFCKNLASLITEELRAKGKSTKGIVNYKRVECQKVARTMSGGKSSYDLCSKMNTTTYTHYHNYSWDRIRGMKPLYKFIYKGGNKFDSSIISTQLFTNNLVLSTDDKKCTNHGSLGKCIQDFVELLKRKKNRCPKCDLKGAKLSKVKLNYATLNKANLSGADLSGAKLNYARLSKANLSKAKLSKASLERSYLNGANLSGANLEGAYMYEVILNKADLRGANLSKAFLVGATLNKANLKGAQLEGATWTDGTKCGKGSIGKCIQDWVGILKRKKNRCPKCDLKEANLSKANLKGADLSGAHLRGADLTGADLSKADLTGADLMHAKLSKANLSGANLSKAKLYRTNLSGAKLEGATWTDGTKKCKKGSIGKCK